VENTTCQCPSPEDCQNLGVSQFLEEELLNTSHCQRVRENWGKSLCRVPHTLSEQLALYEKQGQFGLGRQYTSQSEVINHVVPLRHGKFPFDVFFPPFSRREIELLEQQLKVKLKLQ
jgi:hypothetical protein